MKTICKWSCLCAIAIFMTLAINPCSAEAGRWRRVHTVHVVRPQVYVPGPVVRYHYHPRVNVVAPGVRVQVGRGVRVNIGGWYYGGW